MELAALEDALQRLAALDERKSKVVELKFFGGLTIEEIAEVLQVSGATAEREERPFREALSLIALPPPSAGAGHPVAAGP